MIRIFQSAWFVALAGCVLYLATTVVVLNPSKFAGVQLASPDFSAEDDPSWRFRNPEFNQWVAQIQSEKQNLDLREQQLNELQTRLNAELQEISTVTQAVAQLQENFDKNVVRFKSQETDNVKHQAKLMSAMSPEGAVAMLNEMPDDDAVKILFTMKTDEASLILDALSKQGQPQAKRAAQLTQRLQEVLSPATTTATTATP
jgi:flagellar motility protein MotE (MotC chaperone)